MTKYSQALIDFFTRDSRKPVFIERSFDITPDTPMEDILYTYNEMACRGYLLQERGIFLENACYYSKKPSFNFLYPDVILEVPFEKHPYVIAMEEYIKSGKKYDKDEIERIGKLKDY